MDAILVALQNPLITAHGWLLIAGVLELFPLAASIGAVLDPYSALHKLGPASLGPLRRFGSYALSSNGRGRSRPAVVCWRLCLIGAIVRRSLHRVILKCR